MRTFFQKFDLSQAGRYLITLSRQRLCFSSFLLYISLPPSLSLSHTHTVSPGSYLAISISISIIDIIHFH